MVPGMMQHPHRAENPTRTDKEAACASRASGPSSTSTPGPTAHRGRAAARRCAARWPRSRCSWRPTRSSSGSPSPRRRAADRARAGGGARRPMTRARSATLYELMQRLAFKGGPSGASRERHRGARLRPLGPAGQAARGAPVARARGRLRPRRRLRQRPGHAAHGRRASHLLPGYGAAPRHHGRASSRWAGTRVATCERLAIMRDALRDGSRARRTEPDDRCQRVLVAQAGHPTDRPRSRREFDLVWAEEPVRRDDHRGLARVSRAVRTAVATGENLTAVSQFVPLLHPRGG